MEKHEQHLKLFQLWRWIKEEEIYTFSQTENENVVQT